MSTWTDYCKQACSEYMPSGSVMVCATYRTARWRQSHAALISQMRAKQNEQHGAVVCSNYDLLYLQHILPHKIANKSEYQTIQNLIRNSNKSNKYRITEYWITTLPSTDADRLHWLSCYVFTRESSYCFHHVLAIAILSVHLSVCFFVRPSDRHTGGTRLGLG